MPADAMKENILYWTRVLILTGVLLFILVSCTAWAQSVQDAPAPDFSAREVNHVLREKKEMPERISID